MAALKIQNRNQPCNGNGLCLITVPADMHTHKGTTKNALFLRLLRQLCARILMYPIYTAVLRAVLPCTHRKITIFRGAHKSVYTTQLDDKLVRHRFYRLAVMLFTLMFYPYPPTASAQWLVNENARTETGEQTMTAHTLNDTGYSLEIYKDSASTIRARFSLAQGLIKLRKDSCPTYQIDKNIPDNQSINGTPCTVSDTQAEFILGYIKDNQVISMLLLSVMNGNAIIFRFQLENGDYRETTVSLAGSKRSMTSVIGANIIIRAQ